MGLKPTAYLLQNVATGRMFKDTGWLLEDIETPTPSLIRTVYEKKSLAVKDLELGLYCFADWLPVHRMLQGSSAPVTYRSEGLSKELGLKELYITFSGYWPERNAAMTTCSFKETEAYSVCSRLEANSGKILVVASAGNTARAFAKVCSDNHIPLLLCVPEDCIDALWFTTPLNDCVKLLCSASGSDYFDAIHLSNQILESPLFLAEGGAKNVARRDGMATTMLSAATYIGRTPDYYFQAVGSGTGAIAAWEANLRLIDDGRFGSHKAQLILSQNIPFLPMYTAWKNHSRELHILNDDEARRQASAIVAKVLSNRRPPFSITGGLFDALSDTNGNILCATNAEAAHAAQLFEDTEGIDIHPAAAIAVATLIQAVNNHAIENDKCIMLNITGGGEKRFRGKQELHTLKPSLVYETGTHAHTILREVEALFSK
jgi:cysteate synthase